MLNAVSAKSREMGRPATGEGVAAYPDDVLIFPSRTRPGQVHRVHLNVLSNEPARCSCPAGLQGEWCWARKEVLANECSYALQRCLRCGALCRLGEFYSRSGERVAQLVCSADSEHSGREPAAARLYRTEAASS